MLNFILGGLICGSAVWFAKPTIAAWIAAVKAKV
jgi:hypothetical protein